ncbi:hypothetical protein HOLleu_41704 [Holothuria leucospilota]|uniref:Uncharacterized protein n=1 Tax=Holothuria leucospilota TaxID=206669 RepID=A0A9Q0YC34_HOLLE|nr:hypothetical protein HOLleu_41704 [Holothuria leucospilota]
MFLDSALDIHELTNTINSYTGFCEDLVIPQRPVKCYPNKPWITKEIQYLLSRKKHLFKSGTKQELKIIQSEINTAIKREDVYRRKIENNFMTNNIRSVWDGLG